VRSRAKADVEWVHPARLGLVFLGGACGAALRETLTLLVPSWGGAPLTLWAINMVGAFLLGLLLESLVRRTDCTAGRLRLLLGTGALGGFTSYSALAFAVAALVHESEVWPAIFYGLGTVLLGALATLLGIVLGARRSRRAGL